MDEPIPGSRIGIPLTGDAARDAQNLDRAILTDARLNANLCPNGCGQLTITTAYDRDCPVCQFHSRSNRPHGFTNDAS